MTSSATTRDLIGYGPTPPNPKWPNGAKICLSFVINYEEGGENTVMNGDKGSEVFLNETPGGQSRVGVRDMNMETQYEYGSRVGFWRLLRLFDSFAWKFTCYAVGKAVELNPAVVVECEKRDCDVASHNYRWIDYQYMDEETERTHVRSSIFAIQKASPTNKAPVGFYTGRIGPNSRRIVVEEYQKMGLELVYESDAYNDDLPYWVDWEEDVKGAGKVLCIPYTLDAVSARNDMKFCVAPGFSHPDAFYTYLKDAFDVLYEEGSDSADPSPKMMSIGLHCRLAGKPGRMAALKRFMEYVNGKQGVWVASREEIGRHWRKEFPPA
ncbi:hypothetical protein HK097_002819 [Rhizophlyctis rosea]|uniref:NodB homology domain-containing protein n=1 Tax=Rhizophlyctis rosea TaxID=64517 RepID=A0AAD5S4B9_9FUNG|nr:hypothetical protein HK097_002819 [Rhizophlyctis rosea]